MALAVAAGGYYLRRARPSSPPAAPPGHKFSRPDQELSDFACEVTRAGRRVFSLTGKRLVVQKRKLGFFRFGLLREAVIEEARFEVAYRAGGEAPVADQGPGGGEAGMALAAILPREWLGSLRCKPISFTLRQEGGQGRRSQIRAEAAELSTDGQVIHFRGKVVGETATVRLESEDLDLVPAESRLEVKGSYRLFTGRDTLSGQGLRSDVFLTSIPGGQ